MLPILCRLFHRERFHSTEIKTMDRRHFYKDRTYLIIEQGWVVDAFTTLGGIILSREICARCNEHRPWLKVVIE